MEYLLKLFLPKLLLITPLVALQSLNAQSVSNPHVTHYTVLNNFLCHPNHRNFSLPSTIPLINRSQSVPLTEIEIKPVIEQPVIPLADTQCNPWGEADLILRGYYPEKILPPVPEFSIIFPLFQEIDRFLLTQLSARHNDLYGKQTVYSLGFGQRFWPLNQYHWWGTHLFYDHCPQGKYHRLGLVGEWQNSRARCTVNGYFPLSQWRLAEQHQLKKRPARSLDFRLQWFLLQKPCINLNVLMEHAFSRSLTYPNQSAAAQHLTALTLGLNYTPIPLVTVGYDAKMAHKEKPSHQLQIQFTYRLGIPLAQQLNPALATTGYNPATNRLSPIYRQSTMLLEQREISPPAESAAPLAPSTSAEKIEPLPPENMIHTKNFNTSEAEMLEQNGTPPMTKSSTSLTSVGEKNEELSGSTLSANNQGEDPVAPKQKVAAKPAEVNSNKQKFLNNKQYFQDLINDRENNNNHPNEPSPLLMPDQGQESPQAMANKTSLSQESDASWLNLENQKYDSLLNFNNWIENCLENISTASSSNDLNSGKDFLVEGYID